MYKHNIGLLTLLTEPHLLNNVLYFKEVESNAIVSIIAYRLAN